MTALKSFVHRHAVPIYFVLTFILTWGGMALVVGPGAAGLLMTALVDGRAGFRDLFSRLSRWRVDARCDLTPVYRTPLVS